jgi:hypothetical protein
MGFSAWSSLSCERGRGEIIEYLQDNQLQEKIERKRVSYILRILQTESKAPNLIDKYIQ